MAFSAITSAEITTGEPTSAATAIKIKDNFDDHEERISDLETGAIAFRPIQFSVRGDHGRLSVPLTGLLFDRINFDLTIQTGRLVLLDAGTSGTLEIDIQYKRGANPFATIFSTRPSLTFSAAQFTVQNGILSVTALETGDILRLDLINKMQGCTDFLVELDIGV